MRLAFCPVCHRQVNLAEGDQPVCPVCSSPLVETRDGTEDSTSAEPLLFLMPEIYLG